MAGVSRARPTLIVLEPDPARRLRLVSALRAAFQVLPEDPERTAVRRARDERPDLVLVSLSPRNPRPGLGVCRALKTDLRPGPVGVVDEGAVSQPEEALEGHLADGYLAGEADPSQLAEWALAILAGERPQRSFPARRGLLRRLSGR